MEVAITRRMASFRHTVLPVLVISCVVFQIFLKSNRIGLGNHGKDVLDGESQQEGTPRRLLLQARPAEVSRKSASLVSGGRGRMGEGMKERSAWRNGGGDVAKEQRKMGGSRTRGISRAGVAPKLGVEGRPGARKQAMQQRLANAVPNKNVNISNLRLPTVFLIAAPKTGSTAFAEMLFQHPRMCRPQTQQPGELGRKETHFFSKSKLRAKGLKHLSSMFEHDPKCKSTDIKDMIFFDATPDYMYGSGKAMKQIIPASMHPKLKFLAVFREPISRDVSWLNHARSTKKESDFKFHTYDEWAEIQLEIFAKRNAKKLGRKLNAAEPASGAPVSQGGGGRGKKLPMLRGSLFWGLYDVNLQRWWKEWGEEQTLVLNYDTIVANTTDTLQRVARFLGLDEAPFAAAQLPKANERSYAHKIRLQDAKLSTCRKMSDFFEPHNQELYKLLAAPERKMPREQPPFPPFRDPCIGLI